MSVIERSKNQNAYSTELESDFVFVPFFGQISGIEMGYLWASGVRPLGTPSEPQAYDGVGGFNLTDIFMHDRFGHGRQPDSGDATYRARSHFLKSLNKDFREEVEFTVFMFDHEGSGANPYSLVLKAEKESQFPSAWSGLNIESIIKRTEEIKRWLKPGWNEGNLPQIGNTCSQLLERIHGAR